MPITVFEKHIQELNFSFITDRETSGVLLAENYENLPEIIASPDILFALEEAHNKFEADAVYFRYFQDGRAAVPQLYLFDYTNKSLNSEDRNRIHRNMWNGYQVPAYIIIEKSSVSVFDAREKPKEDREHYAEEIIKRTGDAIKSFNAQGFDNGLFWEEKNNKEHFQFEQSATRDLIRGLKAVYEGFKKQSNLDRHVALRLLVQSLLVKYLEERDEDSKSGYFAKTYFKRNFQCDNFCDVIRKGKLLNLLDMLASDLNGKIFEWNKEAETDAREAIQKSEVRELANYLDGNNQDGQLVIWRLYSFSHLPVEVISSVYEELLTDSKDIVYTPEMIVSTLVDECMPLKIPQKDFKMIDVSCGSGIFLVKAYKRVVQWWRYEQWQKTGKLERPSLSVLKDLLLKSIYGIDIQSDAIRLSIFSLALAILDEVNLDPPTWGKLRFPDMNANIVTKDFFEFISEKPANDFSLVIGNPPFNLPEVNGKEPSRKKYFKNLNEYRSNINIPDENPALHFLVQSMKLLKYGGILSMIQPSGPLLYQKNIKFKEDVFSTYNLLQVIDFTKLADKLWGRKNVATVAVFLQRKEPDLEPILHLVANRTFSNVNRLFLEFDHYDFHFLSQLDAIYNPCIWKAHLLGGGRIIQLLNRLRNLRTLGEFLKEKKKNGWVKGEGFIEKGDRNPASYITNQYFLPTDGFSEEDINFDSIHRINTKYFHRPRKVELYQPPHLLIRKVLGQKKLITNFFDTYLTFLSDIFAIHAPQEEQTELQKVSDYLNANGELLRFYILSSSSRVKVNKATSLYDEDILSIPYPKKIKDIQMSNAEKIILNDVIEYFIKPDETKLLSEINPSQMNEFGKIFALTLNSVYETNSKSFQLYKILETNNYYALHFEYSDKKTINPIEEPCVDLEQYIQKIIPQRNTSQQHIHIQKIMKMYSKDSIILVKPKQLKYWLPSIAIRDADETFADYIKTRYQDA